MVEWKDEQINDHSSGITDIVTASASDFQEICENLTFNVKLQILSSRDGYLRFTDQPTPTKIQQLFKLEDWILALCYQDPLTIDDPISGQMYFRLESDTTSPWTLLPTPEQRGGNSVYRIGTKAGKGMAVTATLDSWGISSSPGGNGGGPTYYPSFTFLTNGFGLVIDPARITTDKKYDTDGTPVGTGTILTWQDLLDQTLIYWTGAVITLYPGTLGTDQVIFDGAMAVPDHKDGVPEITVRSDGDGTVIPFINRQGHLQSSEWMSHLYLAFEPFVKKYTPNPLDPFGEDPLTYPPNNNRIPLRKIVPIATAPDVVPPGYVPTGMNAQLPSTLIGLDFSQGPATGQTYQVYTLRFEYAKSLAPGDDVSGTVDIWAERSWGFLDNSMGPADEFYLQYEEVAADNPFDSDMPFLIADVNLSALAPYSGITMVWGKLYVVYHQKKGAVDRPRLTYQQAVDALNEAFKEYQERALLLAGVTYYAAYENFGYYLKQNPAAKVKEQITGTAFIDKNFYTGTLPEDVAGNYQYGYSFYVRQSYQGLFEGSPRLFTFDGPASFIQVRTLSPVGIAPIKGYTTSLKTTVFQFDPAPTVYGGISVSMNQGNALNIQSQMSGVFARTLDGGEVYFIEKETKDWTQTSSTSLPPNLSSDGWYQKTAYVAKHVSKTPDDKLQFNEPSYVNGGVESYDSLAQGPYYFDVINQVGYHGNIVNNIQRVYESVPGVPASAPATSFDDFDDEVTGLSHFLDKPIVPTQNRLWRIEGQRAADGSGRTFLRTISDEYGCISNQSIVVTNIGVFLWSNTGIVYTDGLKAFRVSDHVIERYNGWLKTVRGGLPVVGPKQLRGRYDELNRLVYWSLYDEDLKPFFVVLSLQKGVSNAMPISVHTGVRYRAVDYLTGVITETDFFETHATLYSDDYQRWYRGQGRYLLMADKDQTFDESQIDNIPHPIVPFYKSVAYSFGAPTFRKQTSKIIFNLRDQTGNGVSMTPLGWNDLDQNYHRLGNCLNYQHLPFALNYATGSLLDLEQFFRHTDCHWVSEMLVNYKRIFGRGLQRQCYKQVGFTALKLFFYDLSIETPGVMDLQITFKAAFPEPTAVVRVLGGTLPPDLGDHSGRFYISWDKTMEPVPVSGVATDGTYTFITALTESDPLSTGDYMERWPDIKIYRLFTDQRIDMIGYNLSYRLIGERTQGTQKSPGKGGVSA